MSSALPKACSEMLRAGLAVHAAAGIGRDLLDLDHRLAEPLARRRLHRVGEPAIERRHDRAGQRRRGLDLDRRRGGQPRIARRAERRQRALRHRLRGLRPSHRRRARLRIGRQLLASSSSAGGGGSAARRRRVIGRLSVAALPIRRRLQIGRRRAEIPLLRIAACCGSRRAPRSTSARRAVRNGCGGGIAAARSASAAAPPDGRRRDRAGRPDRLVGEAERRTLAERRHLQRKIGAAHAGTLDRRDADEACAFLDRARIQAGDLGLAPPRLALAAYCKMPRPHPASATRTTEPTRNQRTPRDMARRMRAIPLRTLQC